MTPHQIHLVRSTFASIAPSAQNVAALFYARLFEIEPTLRPLFRGDLTEQGHKLMQMIGAAWPGSIGCGNSLRGCANSVVDITNTASGTSTTKPSPPHCCGHSNGAWATGSRPRYAMPGPRPIVWWLTR